MRKKILWQKVKAVSLRKWYGRLCLMEAAWAVLGAVCALGTWPGAVFDTMWMSMLIGLFVWPFMELYVRDRRRLKKPEATLAERKQPSMGKLGKAVLGWLVLFIIIYAVWGGIKSMNSSGWISHTVDADITARADWFNGQSKVCQSYPLNTKAAALDHKDVGYAVDSLYCDDGPVREMRVTFWGRLDQPKYSTVYWKCERDSGGFTCNELSGERAGSGH